MINSSLSQSCRPGAAHIPTRTTTLKNFTSEEISAIDQYKQDASDLNAGLRLGKPPDEIVKTLDSALSKSHTTGPIAVYRGCCIPSLCSKLFVGNTIQDEAFMSTSPAHEVAADASIETTSSPSFKKNHEPKTSIIFKINLPRGQPAIDLRWTGWDLYFEEEEILLPRRTTLEIIKISQTEYLNHSASKHTLFNVETIIKSFYDPEQ